jgi:glycosyltransferase involved in cell wall biosynthesis
MSAHVVMMGGFPPPMGGAAKVNEIVHDALTDAGVEVHRIDLSATRTSHRRNAWYHAQRLTRNAMGTLTSWRRGSRDRLLYIVPDGGMGIWYTLGHVLIAGRRFRSLVIHHHNCSHIANESIPMRRLVDGSRDQATHVFLTPGMAAAFQQRYGQVDHRVVSNARFVEPQTRAPVDPPAPPGAIRLGHLSNLCRDKGFFDVADCFDSLRDAGVDAVLTLAGPMIEPEVDTRLAALRQRHGERVRYVGPLHGEAKDAFYRSLDLFLFPTRFAQEAAPIVCYEALAAGVPVVASDRALIAEIIAIGTGEAVPEEAFAARCHAFILRHDWDSDAIERRREAIKAGMAAECRRADDQFAALMLLLGAAHADIAVHRS